MSVKLTIGGDLQVPVVKLTTAQPVKDDVLLVPWVQFTVQASLNNSVMC